MDQQEFDDKEIYFQNFWKNHVEHQNANNVTSCLNLSVPEHLLGKAREFPIKKASQI